MPINPYPGTDPSPNGTLERLKRLVADQQRTRTFEQNLEAFEAQDRYHREIRPTTTTYYNALLGKSITTRSDGSTSL